MIVLDVACMTLRQKIFHAEAPADLGVAAVSQVRLVWMSRRYPVEHFYSAITAQPTVSLKNF
jgi:hypothetical protein